MIKIGDHVDVFDKDRITYTDVQVHDVRNGMVQFFSNGDDDYRLADIDLCSLTGYNSTFKMNLEIAAFCGLSRTKGELSIFKCEDSNPLVFLRGKVVLPINLKFHNDWNHLIPVVRVIANLESRPLIFTLNKLTGMTGDSIEDVHENVWEYIQKIKAESKI